MTLRPLPCDEVAIVKCCSSRTVILVSQPPRTHPLTTRFARPALNPASPGTLPAQLASLQRLTSLDLSYNNLSGTLPPQLTSLTRLRTL